MLELILSEKPLIRLIHGDCMEFMAGCNAEQFGLAMVDPPYGIGEDGLKNHSRGKLTKPKLYTPKNWDRTTPDCEYFTQLRWISKNQIIWGANHFISKIPYDSSCWVIWDKQNGENDFADCEIAWTSFKSAARLFTFRWHGMLQGDMKNKEERLHPTQKPVALYKWLLSKYAKPGDTILDTHGGSMSSVIAAYDMGFDITCIELDKDYFDAAVNRIKRFLSEPKIDFTQPDEPKQLSII